jgi:hypothetical protein
MSNLIIARFPEFCKTEVLDNIIVPEAGIIRLLEK